MLASGYFFTARMAIAHALTLPGLFAPAGLLHAGPQQRLKSCRRITRCAV